MTLAVRTSHVIDRFGDISKDEEQELVAYLAFLRARKGRKQ